MSHPKQIKKSRADELIVLANVAETRNKAQAFIMTSKVEFLDKKNVWRLVEKAGQQLPGDAQFRIIGEIDQDVGRGAKKLRGAIDYWPDLKAKIAGASCLDIGASTGGFSQVLLELGASSVACLDVGTNQLHEKIRNDAKVKSFEQTHVLKVDQQFWDDQGVETPFAVMVTDLSFISVIKVIEHAAEWLKDGGSWVILVKPQFELDASKTPKGIVVDDVHRQEALERVKMSVAKSTGLQVKDSIDCPLEGAKGNREFFLWVEKHIF
ncbi:TlyA family RNA methyltransferase [bacterium]|nr:TlyA family RNA methyltransferase [bacterium]